MPCAITKEVGPPRAGVSMNGAAPAGHLPPGAATGLVLGPAGNPVLHIATRRVPGHGRLMWQGPGARVLQARARGVLPLVAACAVLPHMAAAVFDAVDILVQVQGQAPKSRAQEADLALFLALASLFSGRVLKAGVAAAGVLDLQGRVLPVQDPQACVEAAQAAGLDTLVLPAAQRLVFDESTPLATHVLRCVWLHSVNEALSEVLVEPPTRVAGKADEPIQKERLQ
jgi:ATP-dependent Lon protease